MSQFEYLKQYDPRGRTAWYALPIEGAIDPATGEEIPPEIELCHAGATNKPYASAVGKASAKGGKAQRDAVRGNPVLAQKQTLNLERELFPQFVAKNWRGIPGGPEKREVSWSVLNCKEFMALLPDHIMWGISQFAAVASNFLPDEMPTYEEVEVQAGE